jgi:beta-lactamase class A
VSVTLHYAQEPISARLDELLKRAVQVSDNRAFDALVALVGYDAINGEFFRKRNGFRDTVFIRAYGGRDRDPVTGHSTHVKSPAITLREGERTHQLAARAGQGRFQCPDQGNCTTLRDLCEAMRRVALHESLPPAQRFALGDTELTLLRRVLEMKKLRSHELPAALREGHGGEPLRILDKPGYAKRWMSDVMFVERADGSRRWLVALAGYPGRRVLDDALRQLGAVLASGALDGP